MLNELILPSSSTCSTKLSPCIPIPRALVFVLHSKIRSEVYQNWLQWSIECGTGMFPSSVLLQSSKMSKHVLNRAFSNHLVYKAAVLQTLSMSTAPLISYSDLQVLLLPSSHQDARLFSCIRLDLYFYIGHPYPSTSGLCDCSITSSFCSLSRDLHRDS